MANVKQPNLKPTNKLTAAVLAGAAWELGGGYVVAGMEAIGMNPGDNFRLIVLFALMAAAGYFIKDRPNV